MKHHPVSPASAALKRVAQGGLSLELLLALTLKGGGAVASFAFNLLLVRALGATRLGEFQVALATATLGATVALCGLDLLVTRAVAVAREHGQFADARASARHAVRVAGSMGVGLGVAVAVLSGALARHLFDRAEIQPFLIVMSAAIPLLVLTRVVAGALRSAGKLLISQSLDGVAYTGLATVLLAAAVLLTADPPAPLAAITYLIGTAVVAGTGLLLLGRTMRGWPDGGRSQVVLRAGVPIASVYVLLQLTEWVILAVLTNDSGAAVAGNYRVIFQFCGLFLIVFTAFNAIVGPHIAAAVARHDVDRVLSVARTSGMIGAALTLPLLIVLMVFPAALLSFFDPSFAGGAPALRILAVAHFFNVLLGPLGAILVMSHREKQLLIGEIAAAASGCGAAVLLVPHWGLVGAATAAAITLLVRNAIGMSFVLLALGQDRRRAPALHAGTPASHDLAPPAEERPA